MRDKGHRLPAQGARRARGLFREGRGGAGGGAGLASCRGEGTHGGRSRGADRRAPCARRQQPRRSHSNLLREPRGSAGAMDRGRGKRSGSGRTCCCAERGRENRRSRGQRGGREGRWSRVGRVEAGRCVCRCLLQPLEAQRLLVLGTSGPLCAKPKFHTFRFLTSVKQSPTRFPSPASFPTPAPQEGYKKVDRLQSRNTQLLKTPVCAWGEAPGDGSLQLPRALGGERAGAGVSWLCSCLTSSVTLGQPLLHSGLLTTLDLSEAPSSLNSQEMSVFDRNVTEVVGVCRNWK